MISQRRSDAAAATSQATTPHMVNILYIYIYRERESTYLYITQWETGLHTGPWSLHTGSLKTPVGNTRGKYSLKLQNCQWETVDWPVRNGTM